MSARLSAVQADGCDVVVSRFQNSFEVEGLKGQLSYWLSARAAFSSCRLCSSVTLDLRRTRQLAASEPAGESH